MHEALEDKMTAGLHLAEDVRVILLSDWDPVGIREDPEARDEYDAYARQIAERLRAGASVDELSRLLLDIETIDMGLTGNTDRAAGAARKLWRIVNS